MANRTPHIVGGGLGTIRKAATAAAVAKANQERQAANLAAMRKVGGNK